MNQITYKANKPVVFSKDATLYNATNATNATNAVSGAWYRNSYFKLFMGLCLVTILTFLFFPEALFHGAVQYAPLHAVLEIVSVIVSFGVFSVIWFSLHQNKYYQISACLFLGVAIIDMFHLLSYVGMPDLVTVNTPHKAIIFWLFARYLSVMAIFFYVISKHKQQTEFLHKNIVLSLVVGICFIYGFLGSVNPTLFPATFVQGEGLTTLKIIEEYILVALFISLAFQLKRRNSTVLDDQELGIFFAIIILAISEFLFTLYGSVSDMANVYGHVFKVVAYGIFFKVIVVSSIKRPYLLLQASESALKNLSHALSSSNDKRLFYSICEEIYQQTQADYIVVISYFPIFGQQNKIVSYLKKGIRIKSEPDLFVQQIYDSKLDKETIYHFHNVSESSTELSTPLTSELFICQPLYSESLGQVGAIIIAKENNVNPLVAFKELIYFSSVRLASAIENDVYVQRETAQKRKLAHSLEQARENERGQLARDMHDDLGGNLAALKIDLSILNRQLKLQNIVEETQTKLGQMNVLVDRCITDTREMVNNLRSGVLDDLGLVEALQWRVKEIEKNHNIKAELRNEIKEHNLGIENEGDRVSLFRLISEALTNVIKHAKADQVVVNISKFHDVIRISVIDDGIGIASDLEKGTDSYGLISMKERAQLLNGRLSIESGQDSGTCIRVAIPVVNGGLK